MEYFGASSVVGMLGLALYALAYERVQCYSPH